MRNYYLITFAAVCFCISIVAQNNPAFSQNTTSTSPIACYDLANGLGTDAINSLNGTVSNVSAANGFDNGINMAAQFAGNANSKITLPVSAVLRPQQLSVSMWIKATAINDQYILFHKNALSSNFEAAVIAITGGKIKAIKNKNNSATFTVSDLNTITTNTWVHVAADFGDNLRLWINGTLVGSQAGTGGIDFLSTKSFVLGGSGESFNIPFSGAIDNLAFYDTDISADIATIYANATPCTYAGPAQTVACYDLSNGTALDAINNFNGNVANGTAVNGYNGTTNSAIQLAGTGVSKIILPIAASLRPQALGISMWIKVSSTANQYVLFHKNALSTNFEGAVVGIINGKITAIKNKNAGASYSISDPTNPAANTWVHIAVDFGDNLRLFVNGVAVAAATGTGGVDYDANKSFIVGGSNESFNLPYSGSIDNLVIYNGDISPDITTIYNNPDPCTNSVGLSNPEPAQTGRLYPNPAMDQITLSLEIPGKFAEARIYNINGQCLKTITLTETQTQIDISYLESGMYFLKTPTVSGFSTFRFVKE